MPTIGDYIILFTDTRKEYLEITDLITWNKWDSVRRKQAYYIRSEYKANNIIPAGEKQTGTLNAPKQNVGEEIIENSIQKLIRIKDASCTSNNPEKLVALYEMMLNGILVISQETIGTLATTEELSGKIARFNKNIEEAVKDLNKIVFGIGIGSKPHSPYTKSKGINPFNSTEDLLDNISTTHLILDYINKNFISIMSSFIKKKLSDESYKDWFVEDVKKVIKGDPIVLSFFTERINGDISCIHKIDKNKLFDFLEERDIQFWNKIIKKANNITAIDKSKKNLPGYKAITFAISQLNPIRNLCSHIGNIYPAKEWLFFVINTLIEFADNISFKEEANELRKQLVFEKYRAYPFATEERHYFIPPRTYREVDYEYHYFPIESDKNNHSCWIKHVERIQNEKMSADGADFCDIRQYFFVDTEERKETAIKLWDYYLDRSLLFSSALLDADAKEDFISSYPFHPTFLSILYDMEFDFDTILEICRDAIERAYSAPDYEKCLIMPCDMNLMHPALVKKLSQYFLVPTKYAEWKGSSLLGMQFVYKNYLEMNVDVENNYVKVFNKNATIAREIVKALLLLSSSDETKFFSRDDLRFCVLQPGISIEAVEQSINDLKLFLGQLLDKRGETSRFGRLTDFSLRMGLFSLEDNEISSEEIIDIVKSVGREYQNFDIEKSFAEIPKFKEETLFLKKLKIYFDAIWTDLYCKTIENVDRDDQIMSLGLDVGQEEQARYSSGSSHSSRD